MALAAQVLSRLVALPQCTRYASPQIRADHVLHTELRFHAAAINVAFGAIALDRTDGARMSGDGIPLGGFLDGEGIFGVVAGRDRSRQVVGHRSDDNRLVPTSRRLSPKERHSLQNREWPELAENGTAALEEKPRKAAPETHNLNCNCDPPNLQLFFCAAQPQCGPAAAPFE